MLWAVDDCRKLILERHSSVLFFGFTQCFVYLCVCCLSDSSGSCVFACPGISLVYVEHVCWQHVVLFLCVSSLSLRAVVLMKRAILHNLLCDVGGK